MKTILITGASRGLGLEFCRQYARRGDDVFASCRTPEKASELQELNDAQSIRTLQLDVASESSIRNLARTLLNDQVQIDLLINNAGVSIEEDFGHWTQSGFAKNFKINAIGPALVTQALSPLLRANAKVIFISSGLGSIEQNINPDGPFESYSMSKASLSVLCRRLAAKPNSKSQIFTAISPGWVRTDMGGDQAPTEAADAVSAIVSVIDNLDSSVSGSFLDTDGNFIPW